MCIHNWKRGYKIDIKMNIQPAIGHGASVTSLNVITPVTSPITESVFMSPVSPVPAEVRLSLVLHQRDFTSHSEYARGRLDIIRTLLIFLLYLIHHLRF